MFPHPLPRHQRGHRVLRPGSHDGRGDQHLHPLYDPHERRLHSAYIHSRFSARPRGSGDGKLLQYGLQDRGGRPGYQENIQGPGGEADQWYGSRH